MPFWSVLVEDLGGVFVDETSCTRCYKCVEVASSTFAVHRIDCSPTQYFLISHFACFRLFSFVFVCFDSFFYFHFFFRRRSEFSPFCFGKCPGAQSGERRPLSSSRTSFQCVQKSSQCSAILQSFLG